MKLKSLYWTKDCEKYIDGRYVSHVRVIQESTLYYSLNFTHAYIDIGSSLSVTQTGSMVNEWYQCPPRFKNAVVLHSIYPTKEPQPDLWGQ